jgi:hypothetical protein
MLASGAALVLPLGSGHAAPQPGQQTFATPREAAQALIDAADRNDTAALLKLFGELSAAGHGRSQRFTMGNPANHGPA